MGWKIKIERRAEKELDRLDVQVSQRIIKFLLGKLALLDDPRSIGEALQGSEIGDYWRYRVGDYRIISRIEDGVLTVFVVRVGNRREVYR
jgi:mRNA interferase RelE/StbE